MLFSVYTFAVFGIGLTYGVGFGIHRTNPARAELLWCGAAIAMIIAFAIGWNL